MPKIVQCRNGIAYIKQIAAWKKQMDCFFAVTFLSWTTSWQQQRNSTAQTWEKAFCRASTDGFNELDTYLLQFQILRKLSHDPVATAIPSSVTPKQLTRLSWPARTPINKNIQQTWWFQLSGHWTPWHRCLDWSTNTFKHLGCNFKLIWGFLSTNLRQLTGWIHKEGKIQQMHYCSLSAPHIVTFTAFLPAVQLQPWNFCWQCHSNKCLTLHCTDLRTSSPQW